MLAFIFSVLGHPAVILLHALHWSVGEYAEDVLVETLKVVLPESGRAQMEVVLAGTPEWMVGPLPDGTPDVSSRRLSAESATSGSVIMQTVISLVVLIVVTYITAVIYKGRVTDKRAAWPGPSTALATNDWKYTTFQCFDNCTYCLYGCCCLDLRLADTYTLTNIGPNFYFYIHLYVAVHVVGQIVQAVVSILVIEMDMNPLLGNVGNLGWFIGELFFAFFLAGQRTKLRQALGDPSPEEKKTMDFVCYWCCACCTSIQEGRQVDEITNTQTKCCFVLETTQGGPPAAVVGTVVGTSK
jgi:Cys-rich protein (TIGR01571 family)